jgi:Icc-related predicted phosphoesterase
MPQGDVLVHAGDLTNEGIPAEIFETFAWLSKQPYQRVLCVPGNHDWALAKLEQLPRVLRSKFPNVELLMDSEAVVNGLRVYGSPWQPFFNNWAFNFLPGPAGIRQAEEKWAQIPDDTAILITHGPAYGILDETLRRKHVGCVALKHRIAKLSNLRLYIGGHIHEAYGAEKHGDVLYVNACTCDSHYWPTQPPIVADLNENGARHIPFAEWAT